MNIRTETRRWLTVAATALVAWALWDTPVVWPLKILVVMFHELGHALAALLTGGEVVSIELSPMQGGATHTRGGFRFLVLNAGYLGSLLFGLTLLMLGKTETRASKGAWLLATLLTVSTMLWVRPVLSFGFAFSVGAALALVQLARSARGDLQQWTLRGLGTFSVLYALWDIRDDVFRATPGVSDATMLAELTFIPAPFWGVAWLGAGVATLFLSRRLWL